MQTLGIFPSYCWGLEDASWRWTMGKFQLLLAVPPGHLQWQPCHGHGCLLCLEQLTLCQGSCKVLPLQSLAFFSSFFVSMGHTHNRTQNYTQAKFSWSYSGLAPRPLAVCRSSFVWKWDEFCQKITCRLEFNVKSGLPLVSTDSHFEIWDCFDDEIQSKT